MNRAACKGMTDLFFPPDLETPIERANREIHAGQICSTCTVLKDCRQFAKTNRVGDAFIAGQSRSARARNRRRVAAAAHQPTQITIRRTTSDVNAIVEEHHRALDAEIRQHQMSFDTAV